MTHMQYVCLIVVLLGACAHPLSNVSHAALSTCEVPGAVPGDGLDDRLAIQDALTAQGCAHLPAGTYDIDTPTFVPPARRIYPMLTLSGSQLYGDGPESVLRFRGSAGFQDWEGVRLTGTGPTVHDLTLQTGSLTETSEQTHASKLLGPSTGARVSRMHYNHPIRGEEKGGDCIQVVAYNDGHLVSDVLISDNDFDHCDRSAVAVHSGTSFLTIQDNRFPDTGNTGLDFEGSGDTHDVLIVNNIFHLSPGPHGVCEIQLQLVDHVRVTGNVLNGRGIDIFQSDDVRLDHNEVTLVQLTSVPVVWVHKDSSRVLMDHNILTRAATTLPGNVITATPHNSGTPDHLIISDNLITQNVAANVIETAGVVSLYLIHNAFVFTPLLGNAYGLLANGSAGTLPIRTTDIQLDSNTWSGRLRGIVGLSGSYGGAGTVTSWGNASAGPVGGIVCGNVYSGAQVLGPVTSTHDKLPPPNCGLLGFVNVLP